MHGKVAGTVAKRNGNRESLFESLCFHCRVMGLPRPEAEFRFHPVRRWRFDAVWMRMKLAVEIDGGGWVRGAHHRPLGRDRDNEKSNTAQAMGWKVLRFNPQQVNSGEAARFLKENIFESIAPSAPA